MSYRIEPIGWGHCTVEAWTEPIYSDEAHDFMVAGTGGHTIETRTEGWVASKHWMEWRIHVGTPGHKNTDVFRGSAKWDGCYDFHLNGGAHVCEMEYFAEAWKVLEDLRFELLEWAE